MFLFESQQEKGERLITEALQNYELRYKDGRFCLCHGGALWFIIAEKAEPPLTITLAQAKKILDGIIDQYKPYQQWKSKSTSQGKTGSQLKSASTKKENGSL